MPTTLSRALEGVLDGFATAPLRSATAELVAAYRSGAAPTGLVLANPIRAAAYAAYRMPATHAAVSRALRHAARDHPGLDVRSVLDVGGGTGAASWAAAEALGTVERIEVLDASAPALELGRRLARQGPPAVAGATWTQARLDERLRTPFCDLAVVSYVLGELEEAVQRSVVDSLVRASGLLLVVEPGTPRGYAAVLAARSRLVEAGWHVLVPAPRRGPARWSAARTGATSAPASTAAPCTAGSRAPHSATRTRSSPTSSPRGTRWPPRRPGCSGTRCGARAWCSWRCAVPTGRPGVRW